jgi:cytochrome c oxidase cbb3-type subunit 4
MDSINTMRVVITVVSFLVFIGIFVWAWSGRRKRQFDEAARLPLDDDGPRPGSNNTATAQRSSDE